MLFQEKNARIYGHLVIFSLLQVVIASLLNVRFEFGILLIGYVMVASFAVALLYLQRAVDRFYLAAAVARTAATPQAETPISLRASLSLPPRASFSLPSNDLRRELLKPGLLMQVTGIALGTLLFTVIFFFGIPRANRTSWQATRFTNRSTVGFCDEINLTEMVNILSNEEVVMRATFRDASTNEPIILETEPYFRGGVLPDYDDRSEVAVWRNLDARVLSRKGMQQLPRPPPGEKLVRQEAILEPSQDPTLFTVFPAYRDTSTPHDTRYNHYSRQIVRAVEHLGDEHQQYHFSLLTSSIQNSRQLDITPTMYVGAPLFARRRIRWTSTDSFASPLRGARAVPENRFPGLIIKASQLLADAPTDRIGRAKQLEAYFLESGEFTYSLNNERVVRSRKAKSDPIEDFVMDHKTGHCELFASALVLMLRSQQIPARLVVGYKGGELNSRGKFYKVRQNNAHAWVEAYLSPRDMPQEMREKYGTELIGGWLRLDPTPASGEPKPESSSFSERADYTQMLWDNFVLGLDSRKQKSLYDPLTGEIGFGDFRFKLDLAALRDGKWFNWRAGLVVIAVTGGFLVLFLVLRYGIRGLLSWRWRKRRRGSRRKAIRIEFYERLESLLRKFGWVRGLSQTQKEFAVEVEGQLVQMQVEDEVHLLPSRVVAAFYEMRFGNGELDTAEIETLFADVARLESALKPNDARSTS